MWSPNGKVWSPKMKNMESKISQSRSVMMHIGKKNHLTNSVFSKLFSDSQSRLTIEPFTGSPVPVLHFTGLRFCSSLYLFIYLKYKLYVKIAQ